MELKSRITLDEDKIINILEYIQQKPLNSYVYPELFDEKFNISINECMRVFILLEKKNTLKQVYKVYCPICKDFSESIFEDINELEEQTTCENCGKELFEKENPYKYVVIYFKVLRNE
ncbi:hypothetical protein [Clostridium estertheticum]|uniref:hypothetical protein n=1 Tax=Clostridium estertheticum TaxID=238834 RepID=UPI001CF4CE23|nr:hypothetical protein [Clostridium estertheticum]MCB2361975.1 hypothetical protein [Clostridium estertheticum]